MKTYRIDIKVTGFMTVEVKAGSKKKAEEKASDAFEKLIEGEAKIDDLQCVRLDSTLLTVDGEEA